MIFTGKIKHFIHWQDSLRFAFRARLAYSRPFRPSDMFTLQVAGSAVATEILFAPRPGASFAARPLVQARIRYAPDLPVVLERPSGWPGARVLTLRGEIPVGIAGGKLVFTLGSPGSHSVYDANGAVLHLFAEPESVDLPPADALDLAAAGILPDPEKLQTTALQAVLDRAAGQPGAVVYFPAGVYRSGALFASGSTRLHLAPGAILRGSANPADYTSHRDALDSGRLSYPNPVAHGALLTFIGGHGGGLVGGGALDGSGHLLREYLADGRARELRLNLVAALGCRDLVLRDVQLRDSEFWNTHLYRCENVRIARVAVINEIPHRGWNPHIRDIFWNNADGINSDTCRDVLIEDSFFHTGDDCLTLKLTAPDGTESGAELTDITMRRCVLCSSTSAMKVGTETRGALVERVRFEDMLVLPDHTGSVATISIFDQATVRDVLYRDVRSLAPCRFIDVTIRPRRPDQSAFGSLSKLRFEDLSLLEAGPCQLFGHSPTHAIEDLLFQRVAIQRRPVATLADLNLAQAPHVRGLRFA